MKSKLTRYVCFILALAILFSVNVSAVAGKTATMAGSDMENERYDVGETAECCEHASGRPTDSFG